MDKIQAFHTFLSTLRAARVGFGGGSRQNSGIYNDFCLLRGPRKPISEAAVDKIQAFITIFVYFEAAQADFGGYGRQKLSILPHFCLLQRAYNRQQSKLCISQKK